MTKPILNLSLVLVLPLLLVSCTLSTKQSNNERRGAQNAGKPTQDGKINVDVNNQGNGASPTPSPSPSSTNPTDSDSTNVGNISGNLAGFSTDGQCYKGDDFICKAELACLQQTNAYRGSSRGALKQSAKMAYVARLWSQSQAKAGDISHSGFPNARQSIYNKEFGGSSGDIYAENVAYSWSYDNDPVAVAKMLTDMWWNSAGHRANMVGDYSAMGCGIWKSGDAYYGTQIFGEE